jgi:hypothetical protein
VKFTQYFHAMRQRPDRAIIRLEWIQYVIDHPEKEVVQQDGRIRRWASISEMGGQYLRVILLSDGETVHNAFFNWRFTP